MNPFVDELLQDMSKRTGVRCVLAGGAVRDLLMGRAPKDYDVFALGTTELPTHAFDGLTPVETAHQYEPFLQGTFQVESLIVQVMAVKHTKMSELIDTFDWYTSCFGYDPRYSTAPEARIKTDDIGPGKILKLQKMTYPLSTLRRGFRFSERWAMSIDDGDLAKLCLGAASEIIKRKNADTLNINLQEKKEWQG